jgi:hypothetical protein
VSEDVKDERSDEEKWEDVELPKHPLNVQASYEYLKRLPVSLWGDYLISIPDRRLAAARWLAKQIAGVDSVLRDGKWSPR